MAYKISDDCMTCGTCISECKNNAISEGKKAYVIDYNLCTECVGWDKKSQCAENCSQGAPVPDPTHKETKEQLLAKWQKINPGKKPKLF